MWKATKNREKVFSTPRGNAWLEKKLPMPLDLPAIPQCVTPKEVKLRKPFVALSKRGKRRRMETLFTRTPQVDELEFLREKTVKRQRLVMECSATEQRKKDNDTLLLFFYVNRGKNTYMMAAQRHNWPSYYQVKKAKENVLYPKNICYGESRVELGLTDLISHSCSRILEFLIEDNNPAVMGLTETEKMSLELWCKVGGDGQGDHSEYSQKNIDNVDGSSIYCISYVPLQLAAKGKLIWVNKEPNSPLICQPLVFTFAKETDEFIQCEEKKLRMQAENLPEISFSCGSKEFCLKASSVKV